MSGAITVDDGLWEQVEALIPIMRRRFRNPGRKRLADRLPGGEVERGRPD
jgi:hypothetical protein